MGGGGGPIAKVKEKVKKVENVAKVAFNPMGALAATASKRAGVKADAVFNPIGTVAGNAGEKLYDKPQEAKAEAKRFAAEEQAAQGKALAELEGREKQEKAEKSAAEALETAKARQRKKADKGRRSTILTDSLGGAGGEENQNKKSLLGL